MKKRGTWIACVGPIGVGKSTLAAVVARRTHAQLVPERFGDNAFLERFYAPGGIERWGFQTEVSFLTQRYDQVREIDALDGLMARAADAAWGCLRGARPAPRSLPRGSPRPISL